MTSDFFTFFMGSQVCHIVAYQLCSKAPIDVNELQLYVLETMSEEGKPVGPHVVNSCIYHLRQRGLVEEEVDAPPEYTQCLERAKKDKRIKNPRRYCARKYPIRVYIKPSIVLCEKLVEHAQAHGAISGWEWWPVWG